MDIRKEVENQNRIIENEIYIKSIFLDILKNHEPHEVQGIEITKENLLSLNELAKFFSIQKKLKGEFEEIIKRYSSNVGWYINGDFYISLPKLISMRWVIEMIIPLTIFYLDKNEIM
jgi:hypothetical protein